MCVCVCVCVCVCALSKQAVALKLGNLRQTVVLYKIGKQAWVIQHVNLKTRN